VSKIASSALWGKKEGGSRSRALIAALAAVAALAAPALARAGDVPPSLLAQAQAHPSQTFDVIVQTAGGSASVEATVGAITSGERRTADDTARTAKAAATRANALTTKAAGSADGRARDAAAKAQGEAASARAGAQQAQAALQTARARARGEIRRQYSVIPAVNAVVTGADLLRLQESGDVVAVTPDAPVSLSGNSNPQKWLEAMQAKWFWASPQRRQAAGHAPAIAIVDSGIDASRVADFGSRVLAQVNLDSLGPNSPGDGRGHGTMVASIAAGAASNHAGADPDAALVSLDVVNDNGEGLTSDVIGAIDWILQNRTKYNIRVANFSLESATNSSFLYDPLSRAVEQLWFNGVVVVAAAGNYASGGAASGVLYAPASDPFVITVGAVDIGTDANVANDVAAPWSAWGYTNDGFLKPDISAPGRYIIGACSPGGTLCQTGGQNPALAPTGYIQLSGTSFAAPMVSAAAAALLGLHPDWTPDQVKGRLMLTAYALPAAVPGSVGVGELNLKDAVAPTKTPPPNPNLALEGFVSSTGAGSVFDAASWSSAAQANASWNSASWSSASWSSASWSSASWSSASWSSASWTSAAWDAASWSSSTNDLSLVDNASLDPAGEG
jgi:Subtilase family